ncbi:MAG: DNA recombination protein RmuC [Patescibacteria group bacterium]|nr:DNA recombination protein RmuC [Patescibacteria group bacterium]MDD5490433.1 DNA recombination protein RmuC [Patescibacteria group bacterium]
MEIVLVIIGVFVLVAIGWLILEFKKKEAKDNGQDNAMETLNKELQNIRSEFRGSLEKNLEFIQRQTGQSHRIISEVTEKLTKIDETNRQVVGFAEQLQSLEDILKNPKQRGILGEYFLETILKNVLPPQSYEMQYKFKDGVIVDAVIFVQNKIIPIDSKFSLENYNKILAEKDAARKEGYEKVFKEDLKKRIDETSKYIRPNEKTMDFAFMFIPSEGVYYDLLINQVGAVKVNTRDLIEYAFKEKHVIIVSPTSFFAYLQTVLQGLRALQIEESAKEIREHVEDLQKHLLSYESYLQKLGNNLGTTVNMYNSAYKEFKKVDKDVTKITGKNSKIEPIELDKPNI